MAAIIEKTQVRLQFDGGIVDGKQRYKNKTFSNIKEEASDESILVVSDAINSLSEKDVLKTRKVVTTRIE